MDEVKAGVRYAFQSTANWCVCVSGTGHAAMEASLVNVLEAGDKALFAVNGIWANRAANMAHRMGRYYLISISTVPTGLRILTQGLKILTFF